MLSGTPGATYIRDDAVGLLTAREVAQQGGLDVVGQGPVLGLGDGLEPRHTVGVEANRDGDLGWPLGKGRS